MNLGYISGSQPTSSTGAATPMIWWMLQYNSRWCGVAAARYGPRHGQPFDERGGALGCEDTPPICYCRPGVEYRQIQDVDLNTISCSDENSCTCHYWLGSASTKLYHYLVKGVVYLLLCWFSLACLSKQVENPYPTDVSTMMIQERLSYLSVCFYLYSA